MCSDGHAQNRCQPAELLALEPVEPRAHVRERPGDYRVLAQVVVGHGRGHPENQAAQEAGLLLSAAALLVSHVCRQVW